MERERVQGLLFGATEQDEANAASACEENANADKALLESIWIEFEGMVDRERIRSAIERARAKYANARVKTFVPILVRRHILEELRLEDGKQVFDGPS